jgi:hypothetical protein
MGRAGVRTRRRTQLHLLDQFVDLNAGCPCDAQWQCVRAFRCDGPADRRNAGDRNGGTRQELCEQVTATDFSHVFPPVENIPVWKKPNNRDEIRPMSDNLPG